VPIHQRWPSGRRDPIASSTVSAINHAPVVIVTGQNALSWVSC
jgi:hypothetical protein